MATGAGSAGRRGTSSAASAATTAVAARRGRGADRHARRDAGRRPCRARRGARAAPDGHQAQSPASVVIAGTRIERTRNVSMSTPIATATPIWNRTISEAVAIEPNVPARIRPADVMTAPVWPDAIRTASRIGRCSASSRTRCIRKML